MSTRIALSENYMGNSVDVFIIRDDDSGTSIWHGEQYKLIPREDIDTTNPKPSFNVPYECYTSADLRTTESRSPIR